MSGGATKRKAAPSSPAAGAAAATATGEPGAKRLKGAVGAPRSIEVDAGTGAGAGAGAAAAGADGKVKTEGKKPATMGSATAALKKKQAAAAAAASGRAAGADADGAAPASAAASAAGAGAGAGAATAARARGGGGGKKDSPELAAFVALCEAHPSGVRDEDIAASLPNIDAATRSNIVNELVQQQRLKLFRDADQTTIIYKIVPASDMAKFHNLKHTDMTVYTLVENSKKNGIWVKDMRQRTGLSMTEINKSIKLLTARQLIKAHHIVGDQTKNRRMFVLFDVEPGKDSSSGPWYQGGEFDEPFLDFLLDAVFKIVAKAGREGTSPLAVSDELGKSGAFTVPVAAEDVGHAMLALLYDGKVEVVPTARQLQYTSGVGAPPLYSAVEVSYRSVRGGVATCNAVTIPCTVCPVADQCHEGNVVNPRDCKYYEAYLKF